LAGGGLDTSDFEFKSDFNSNYSLITRRMLRLLSENARISISEMSKQLGISRESVRKRLKKIEAEFGIGYTVELNEEALSLPSAFLIAVKFSSRPNLSKIRGMLEQSAIPQIAVSTKGGYEMIVCAVAASNKEYAHWDKSMQIALSEYGVDWKSSAVVHRQLGFFPLRDGMIEKLEINARHKEMLKVLNNNSRITFNAMSEQLGMHFNTVAYNFKKLTKYIKRFTITMAKPADVTLMSFFAKYRPKEGYEATSAKARKAFMSDDENSLVSRYLLCAPLIGSFDFFTLGAFDSAEVAYKRDVLYHKRLFAKHGIRISHAVVESVLLGRLPIRSIDAAKEYSVVKWTSDFSS
jgi:DNA-binding Lrp family transcriptional regulator